MLKNTKKQLIGGIITSIIVWMIFVIADYVEENVIDKGFCVGLYSFVLLPIVMVVCYGRYYIANRPDSKEIFVWFGSYYISFLLMVID